MYYHQLLGPFCCPYTLEYTLQLLHGKIRFQQNIFKDGIVVVLCWQRTIDFNVWIFVICPQTQLKSFVNFSHVLWVKQ